MAISMHSASAPVFVRMFTNLLSWLDKAEAHAAARKFDAANYLGLRLAPDMLPFTRQIQIASADTSSTASPASPKSRRRLRYWRRFFRERRAMTQFTRWPPLASYLACC